MMLISRQKISCPKNTRM